MWKMWENVGKRWGNVENLEDVGKMRKKCEKLKEKTENVEKSCLRGFVTPYGLEVLRLRSASGTA